ncbi:MAG: GNAT family N-acetyltransferase [Chloroflexota bacterium]
MCLPTSTSTSDVTFRPARAADVPRMVDLIAGANLPPAFVEEYLDGFIAAERDGETIACGGVEMYAGSAVIRSVVVDDAARGLGIGRRLAELLMAHARAAGAKDLYLFTADALPFWQQCGFVEVTLEDWQDAPRACWQYQFISQNRSLMPDVHTMWRKA